MNENNGSNGSFFPTLIAIIFAGILGLNVYHTEKLKEEVASLGETVNQLYGRIDSLQMQNHIQKPAPARVASSVVQKPKASQAAVPSSSVVGRVAVSAKAKVENRYVLGTTYLPKVSTGPTGVVVINVTMDRVGIVSAVSVNGSTTIADEDVIDACKEAALKTSFGYNPEAPNKSTGTITYTFTAR
jgi:hypothetical protein